MRSYLGVTVHFITEFRLMIAMLACCRFSDSHIGGFILQHYMEIEKEFVISDKVNNIITETVSNMLKAFHLLEVENEPTTSSDSTNSDDEEELQPVEICSSELDDKAKPLFMFCTLTSTCGKRWHGKC